MAEQNVKMNMGQQSSNQRHSRLKSIDVFRGLTIGLMIMGNNPGNPERFYPQLRHATWNGLTIADLGFPFFIFIMGMVVPYTTQKRMDKGIASIKILTHIFIRSIGLFILGLILNGFPLYDLSKIRIPGVLQRIAVAYLFTGLLVFCIKKLVKHEFIQIAVQAGLALIIVIIYHLSMKFINVPGHGSGVLELDGNLVQYIDLKFLKGHLYKPNWDPEGLFSTFSSISTALFGAVAGHVLFMNRFKKVVKPALLCVAAVFLIVLARGFNLSFPYNKNLWSSSYVLLTAGLAFIIISLLYIIVDVLRFDGIFEPFNNLGQNAITVYVVSTLISKSLWIIPVKDIVTGKTEPFRIWATTNIFAPWAGTVLDSFYFSLFYLVIWILIASIMTHKRK